MPTSDIRTHYPPTVEIRSSTARTSATAAAGDIPSSSLSGRARAEPARGARAPFLQQLGAMFKSLVRRFRPAGAEGGQLLAARQGDVTSRWEANDPFARSIEQTCNVIKSPSASPEDIRAELLGAERAANGLKRARGGPQAVLDSLGQALRSVSEQDLTRVAKALRGTEVAEAQKQLRDPDHPHPGAEKLLVQIETAINRELIQRLETPIQEAVSTALAGIGDHARSEHIADQFHHAFDIAVPLAKLGALHLNEACQLEVDRLVMRQLDALPEDDRKAILRNVRSADLARLHARSADLIELRRARGQQDSTTVDMVRSEIEGRPLRLFERFLKCHQQLCDPPRPLASHAFLNGLAATASALEEFNTHHELHGIPTPRMQQSFAELRKRQVQSAVTAAVDSGHLDPSRLSGAELLRLSRGLNALGIHGYGNARLHEAQQAHVEHCRAALQEKLEVLVRGLVGGSGPAPMLHALGELEDASSALRQASVAFNLGRAEPAASSSATPAALDGTFSAVPLDGTFATVPLDSASPAAQASVPDSDPIEDLLRDSPAARSILAQAFSEAGTRALISSLHVGAQLAGEARETVMAERFANMARLSEQIAGDAAAGQASGSSGKPAPALSSLSPAAHRQFAAAHLMEAARKALREAYALAVPADGVPTLQAGRFDPLQTRTMALTLERPASASEATLVSVGRYPMSQQFLKDANRRFSFYINDAPFNDAPPSGRALIDWSGAGHDESDMRRLGITAEAAEHLQVDRESLARIAQGHERLIELCGSEQQARTLTCYANQAVMAGYAEACALSAAYSLPDGTRGYVTGVNGWSGPDGQTLSKQTTRITFSIGESGRPRIDVDDRIEGRSPFLPTDGSGIPFLSSDSYAQAHFRAELGEDGRLALLEAPSYRFDIRPDDFQKEYPLPTVAMLEAAEADDQLVKDALSYADGVGAAHEIRGLRALAAFEREPTGARADEVVRTCTSLPMSRAVLQIVDKAKWGIYSDQPEDFAQDPDERRLPPDLFGDLRQMLGAAVEKDVLPGMIEAVRRKDL